MFLVAFADVRRQIERTQTMTMMTRTEMTVLNKPVTVAVKMYFKSPGRMRQEMTFPSSLPTGATQTASAPNDATSVAIMDMENQKGISLIPAMKKAVTMEFRNVPPEVLTKTKQQDFLEGLKQAVAGEHEEPGEKTMDGRRIKGYRCKNGMITMDLWVDAATGNPVLAEQTVPQELGLGIGKMKVTMTDFVLNPALDDSLFDTRMPEGYSLLMNQAVDFNVKEEDVTAWLGIVAKECGGVFPKAFLPSVEDFQKAKPRTSRPSSASSSAQGMAAVVKETLEMMKPLQKALAFQMQITMEGGEFVYAGEGVKLGDKAAPVVWYKAKDAKTYRVIYGDLHGEDAQNAPKPASTRPATQPG